MPTFKFEAADSQGVRSRGHLSAATHDAAGAILQRQGMIPLTLKPVSEGIKWWPLNARGPRWSLENKILFTRKFGSLLRAGIPLLTLLDMIARQMRAPQISVALHTVRDRIAGGEPLAEALAAYPTLFDPVYLGAVKAGEATGRLDTVLEHTAAYLERELETRRRIKEAIRYPIMVIIALIAAAIIVLRFVVPKFAGFYNNYGGELPVPTQMLMFAADLVGRLWWLSIPVAALVGLVVWWLHGTEPGRVWRDRQLLRLPLIGVLFIKVAVSRFARLFGVLFSAGLPTTEALNTTTAGVGNRTIAAEVAALGRHITGGGLITGSPPGSVMPDLVYQMISIGFESGDVDGMLSEVARHYEQEIDYDVRNLTDRLQPILLVFLATGVLGLALSVLLPLWNLMSIFRG